MLPLLHSDIHILTFSPNFLLSERLLPKIAFISKISYDHEFCSVFLLPEMLLRFQDILLPEMLLPEMLLRLRNILLPDITVAFNY